MPTMQEWVFDEIQDNIQGYTEEEARNWVENDAICVSGSVVGLIYYSDTVKIFDNFEYEILDLAKEYGFNPDIRELGMQGFKNQMTWFAFEVLKDSVFENRLNDFKFVKDKE